MPHEPAHPPSANASGGLVGHVVNEKYDVQAMVASGGMGKIYRAEQRPLGRTVALKVMHASLGASSTGTGTYGSTGDPQFKKRFFREASILSKLQHPNIVTVFDYGKIDGLAPDDEQFFMAMEYLPGETLQKRIQERGALPAHEVVRIARQVARGLREAHANGIVHRDLKPSNIMLTPGRDDEDLVKILDFGIVKLTAENPGTLDRTQEGLFIGSPNYMAPEQVSTGKVDGRTDIYAFGVILYVCLTGKLPFEAETSIQIMMAHLNQAVVPPRQRAPEAAIPEWFEALVLRCLEKDPEHRPASVNEILGIMADATGTYASSSSSLRPGHLASSIPPDAERSRVTRTVALGVTGAIAVALAVAVGVFVVPRSVATTDPLPSTPSAPVSAPTPSATPKSFVLYLESKPAGAEVFEGGAKIGTTTLQVTVDNDEVRAHPRRFQVKLQGFEPYSIVQSPSNDDVRIVAFLTPLAASESDVPASVRSSDGDGRAPPAPAPKRPSAAASAKLGPASSSDLDIRLKR